MSQARDEEAPSYTESANKARMRGKWAREPSWREVLLFIVVAYIFFFLMVSLFSGLLFQVNASLDNQAYMSLASAIRHWNFQLITVKAFWGLPYVMAVISLLTRMSDLAALLVVSYCACLVTLVLAYRLWGGWIAGYFTVVNFDWLRRSFLGGTEPLFMALLFGAFFAARRKYWLVAAILASLSATVRPVGVLALAGVGLALLWKRDFRNFSLAALIGIIVGGLYMVPLAVHFGNPLANVQAYREGDWEGGRILTWPLYAIIESPFLYPAHWINLVLTFTWVLFVLAGFVALILTKDCRQYWRTRPTEMIFAVSYLAFLYTYNSPRWVGGTFSRLAIPVLPFVLLALEKLLPKDRRLLWGLAIASPILTVSSAIGIESILQIIRRTLG